MFACLALAAPPAQAESSPDPRQLHHLVCASAYEILLGEDTQAAVRLRQLSAGLPAPLQQSISKTLVELNDTQALVGKDPTADGTERINSLNQQLLATLIQIQSLTPTAQQPLDDLPERLDFALALYVMRFQLNVAARPARELPDSYLSLEVDTLAQGIDHDLVKSDWAAYPAEEQQALLNDAQVRWKYVANQLLRYRFAEPTPMALKRHVSRISSNLRELREKHSS